MRRTPQDEAVRVVYQSLQPWDPDSCPGRIEELVASGHPLTVPALVMLLKDRQMGLRAAAAEGLVRIGTAAVPVLGELLRHWDWDVRARSAGALGRIGDPDALPALEGALGDANEVVCIEVMRAVGRIGAPQSGGILLKALDDPLAGVRAQAALALGQARIEAAVPGLVRRLLDESHIVRGAARHALGLLQWRPAGPREECRWQLAGDHWRGAHSAGPGGVEPLCEALRSSDAELRRRAAEVLAELSRLQPHPALWKAVPLLRARLRFDAEEAEPARAALERIERDSPRPPDLPLPVEGVAADGAALPIPAEGAEADPHSLPLPSAEQGP